MSTIRKLALWARLALSIVLLNAEVGVVNSVLARTTDPVLSLVAFRVAYSLALLLEAPILILLDVSVAYATGRRSFGLMRRLAQMSGLAIAVLA
jgi:hypothetical protein